MKRLWIMLGKKTKEKITTGSERSKIVKWNTKIDID